MKGDFTRRTFDRRDHYRAVLLQQGRVQLDADWNEQADIWAHLAQQTADDTIGAHGGPLPGAGMAVTDAGGARPSGTAPMDLRISAGRYYVGGVLCENEDVVPLAVQPDLPGVPLPKDAGRYAAYLDVWCEHVTALERPALREVALGGPDTATRARTVWQLRLSRVADGATCPDVAPPWEPPGTTSTGRLRARAKAPAEAPLPCVIPAGTGYRRLENQLYRVEILDPSGSPGGPTYVWSRDNGSVAARLLKVENDALTLEAPPRDERLGFAKDDWVEVTDAGRVRRGEPGFLGRLGEVTGTRLPVAEWRGGPPVGVGGAGGAAVVRRWDGEGATAVEEGWAALNDEDGVEIQFEKDGVHRTGDHWLIPARTADLRAERSDLSLAGDVEWPRTGGGDPLFRPRAGVEHLYAAVALLDLAADGKWTGVADCRRLFPPLTGLTDVEYAGGDGQEAMPGDPLPQPLAVSVCNGTRPVEGARVRFVAADADGRLARSAADLARTHFSELISETDGDGIARCFWLPAPDPARPSQRVTARLIDPAGTDVAAAPVLFSAGLSIAAQVAYEPGSCPALRGTHTVQEAIDRLARVRSLVALGGDGQDGRPDTALPLPVEVLVRGDCGPVEGAAVTFRVDSGAVGDRPDTLVGGPRTVDLGTDQDGVARCFWLLGPTDPVQTLTAELAPDAEAPSVPPTLLAFTANLRSEPNHRPGLHVKDVFIRDRRLWKRISNDISLLPQHLQDGILVGLDGPALADMLTGKPVLTVTLDLPFPFSRSDVDLWGDELIGTMPLTLAGQVTAQAEGAAVLWEPNGPTSLFLMERLFPALGRFDPLDRVLCHLTLTGRAIADSRAADRRVVNGLTLGLPGPGNRTDMELPSIDDVTGADFTMWFWLVRELPSPVVLPTRSGLLRLKSARDALTLSLRRTELLASLPAGVPLSPEAPEPDPDAALRAADRAFRGRPERRLVLVVDERYVEAATVLGESLGGLNTEVELIVTAEPAVTVRERRDAGEELDGVLTDERSAAPVQGLGGFTEAIGL
ncbi:DUF6519 domain-containing protein [Streptomyces sp. NPDC021093]|uniref:DUF6519 domain-containing protein n=1 Tax=Streptomyces sp. NPDC021093 TaxID=3365112 RepID=UPI003789B12E